MHGLPARDGDRAIDWGKTARDYARFRPGPPPSFYARLATLGIGTPGQAILDLGTGTGVLARQFARQGAVVHGVDACVEQITMATALADDEGLDVEFQVAPAEDLPWPDARFDVATANQCWLYFDADVVAGELRRVLRPPGGRLVTSHFSWLPREDPIAHATERLVLEHNPDWSAADWAGVVPPVPTWAEPDFDVEDMFVFDEPIAFTTETWRGRIRACRGVGAVLDPDAVERFDAAHEALLREITTTPFTVLHRIDAHVLRLRPK